MPQQLYLLKENVFQGEIDIHTDLLSVAPSALSRKRSLKTGQVTQEEMGDKNGFSNCILCNPQLKPKGTSLCEICIDDKVADFVNDFPYLPGDQRVIFLWHNDIDVRNSKLHKFRLCDFSRVELYWLLKGALARGKVYNVPKLGTDLMRMVVGFNLGALAGQSIPHFHLQYGWEVALSPRIITPQQLMLYFEELNSEDLIIQANNRVKLVAPWTPKGQYALELYFNNKYDFNDLDDNDAKIFAVVGYEIIRKYVEIGIQNLNIVFTNSPKDRQTEPLVAHFVPRVNMSALYEIKGVNVVDTPPNQIRTVFAKPFQQAKTWASIIDEVNDFDPDKEYVEKVR